MTWTIIIPIIGIIALLVAAGLAANVKKQSEGTDRMKEAPRLKPNKMDEFPVST